MAVRELTAGLWREAFEAAMAAPKGLPGYVIQPKESLGEPPLDRGFIDDCRSAFANLTRLVGHGGVIAVVSPHRAEGRSAVAAGMGLAVAHDLESRVLLVDLELREPGQGALFGVPDAPGLSDHLADGVPLRLIGGATDRRLWLLTAGSAVTENATRIAHLLARGSFFAGCRETFAWTILDLPPLLESTDAALLCGLADVCLLVGRYRHTSINALSRAAAFIPPQRPIGFLLAANASRVPGWIDRML
jgi:Mrp family chromosome partitioning ATPase